MNSSIELISIGTELLSGRTLNSHAQTLGRALTEMGLSLSRDTTIPDGIDIIQSAVKEAFGRVDIVIVSGGLGPTVDDITREALAGLFERKIVLSTTALEAIATRYAARGHTMNPASERMAMVLDGAETLINSAGAAAAQRLDLPNLESRRSSIAKADGKTLFIVPGPPKEFAAVLDDHIIPWLSLMFPDAAPNDLRVMTTHGIGESSIVMLLEKANFQCSEFSIGFYPGSGKVEIRLSAPASGSAALDKAEQTLRELLQEYLIR